VVTQTLHARSKTPALIILRAGNIKVSVNVYIAAAKAKFPVEKSDQNANRRLWNKPAEILSIVILKPSRRQNSWEKFVCDLQMWVESRGQILNIFYRRVVFHFAAF
jgi:hypothetical protein